MKLFFGILASYFLGSIPSAYLVTKGIKGIDIRTQGSGNVGATNVFRVVGRKWGIAVLIFDMFKGFFSAAILPLYFSWDSSQRFTFSILCGIASIAGHTWTVWLKFRGGKGVATSAGVFLGLTPLAAAGTLISWAFLFAWKRYVSLASLGAALIFPLLVFACYRHTESFGLLFPVSIALTGFIFYTHRKNIERLRKGTEKRLI